MSDTSPATQPRVAVLGAGLAGLSAARTLATRDFDVTVFEARDRVGGRVWSETINTPEHGGVTIERGAEFVLDGYEALRAVAERLGLSLVETGMSYYVRELAETPHIHTSQVAEAGRQATELAQTFEVEPSVSDVLDQLEIDAEIKAGLKARIEISTACEADTVAASTLQHTAAFDPKPSWRVGGGNQQIALGLAAELGERVKLTTPVRGVSFDGDEAVVHSAAGDERFDFVVVALPLSFVNNPELFHFPITRRRRTVLSRIVQGHVAKLHIPLAARPETSAIMSVAGRFWTWTAMDASGEVGAVLNSLVGSPSAVRESEVHDGDGKLYAAIKAIRPDLDLDDDLGRVLTVWDEDPWARGSFSSHAPGWSDADSIEVGSPIGNLYFAGEYVDPEFTCLMEGALRSGMKAADDIAAAALA
ncbi:NAD(P)/FAD-dependent oxidoreductase [Homoserinimonas sp. OAct 916]|uniref:flavin monoamine oxidase family protein n=1 Tax=Homoserinimonas sp. OAct 916 TaxID=2211450 RepID=UPI000DBE699E|nr:NAD(P)/FAD-dependent oxidoreductase [Homoserinimonas sp. OAct 916]